jgi:hypothetical protein
VGLSETLSQLHSELAKQLLQRIQSGEATAADFQAARGFLKDNSIDAIPTEENSLGELADELPEYDGEQPTFKLTGSSD